DTNAYALSWLLKYDGQQTRLIGYPCDTDRNWDIYEVDELFPVRFVDFEDTRVPVANKAEKLLSDFYGDWQTPPPNELRIAHYPDILDFGEYAHI
ncbi:MAG: LicD family protein, partial [Eggerthellaceae bacterium]|nr:LicD family protein [Eggerthellaceae bacterium]